MTLILSMSVSEDWICWSLLTVSATTNLVACGLLASIRLRITMVSNTMRWMAELYARGSRAASQQPIHPVEAGGTESTSEAQSGEDVDQSPPPF